MVRPLSANRPAWLRGSEAREAFREEVQRLGHQSSCRESEVALEATAQLVRFQIDLNVKIDLRLRGGSHLLVLLFEAIQHN
jgi:hypothetical protein